MDFMLKTSTTYFFRCRPTKYKIEREKYLPSSLTTNPYVLISEDATLNKNIKNSLQEIMKRRECTKDI